MSTQSARSRGQQDAKRVTDQIEDRDSSATRPNSSRQATRGQQQDADRCESAPAARNGAHSSSATPLLRRQPPFSNEVQTRPQHRQLPAPSDADRFGTAASRQSWLARPPNRPTRKRDQDQPHLLVSRNCSPTARVGNASATLQSERPRRSRSSCPTLATASHF